MKKQTQNQDQTKIKRGILNTLGRSVQIFVQMVGVFVIVMALLFNMVPTSRFFGYQNVAAVNDPFDIGAPITMISTSYYNGEYQVIQEDNLWCMDGDKLSLFSNSVSIKKKVNKQRIAPSKWTYGGESPNYPTTCEIRSEVTVYISYTTPVKVSVVSTQFDFVDKKIGTPYYKNDEL